MMMEKLGNPAARLRDGAQLEEALAIAAKIGYPLMVRPSYVLGGRGMEVVHDEEDLTLYVTRAVEIWPELPILIDKFLETHSNARPMPSRTASMPSSPRSWNTFELAGIHSGDSACVLPSVSIPEKHRRTIEEYTRKIAIELKVLG